eukprot:3411140-Pleurochrysis_carterae.AAC.3
MPPVSARRLSECLYVMRAHHAQARRSRVHARAARADAAVGARCLLDPPLSIGGVDALELVLHLRARLRETHLEQRVPAALRTLRCVPRHVRSLQGAESASDDGSSVE